MTLPVGAPMVTVTTGQWVDSAGAGDYTGTITFTPVSDRFHIATEQMVTRTPVVMPVVDGVGSVALLASDADGYTATNVQYQVETNLNDRNGQPTERRAWRVFLPAASPNVDIDSMLAVAPSSPGTVTLPAGVLSVAGLTGAVAATDLAPILAPLIGPPATYPSLTLTTLPVQPAQPSDGLRMFSQAGRLRTIAPDGTTGDVMTEQALTVLHLPEADTPTQPSTGGSFFVQDGYAIFMGSGGSVTVLGPA